jgi:ribonucleoside-diphosphate reductase alpha chain
VRGADGEYHLHAASDYAWRLWQQSHPDEALPGYFVTAPALKPSQHLEMQSALQPYVDSAISKTINVPVDYDFDAFKDIYQQAYRLGLKGCTSFRPNEVTGSILTAGDAQSMAEMETGCCNLERESG